MVPRRFIVAQRLAQCMHPALPSGLHLKALETYDLIFRCIGTDRLVQELSIYSNGLFPLLSHAAINVKPALLDIYLTHFVPLGPRLRPALDGFLVAVLPGLEENSEFHQITENLLKQICDGVSRDYFYGALWRCVLNNPSVRLPAVSFIISQFNKKKGLEEQIYIMGTNPDTICTGICTTLLDPNVLVQRGILDLLILCFPVHNTQVNREDMISIMTTAVTVLLRRDISLNRRLLSWLLGMETSTSHLAAIVKDKKVSSSAQTSPAQTAYPPTSSSSSSSTSTPSSSSSGSKSRRRRELYFEHYSKHFVTEAFTLCLTVSRTPIKSLKRKIITQTYFYSFLPTMTIIKVVCSNNRIHPT